MTDQELIRIEYQTGYGRTRIRYVPRSAFEPQESKRANLAAPMLIDDSLPDGTYSGADGKAYTSKAALRASYLPSGNPQGKRYEEIGNETLPDFTPPPTDTKGIDEALGKAAAKLGVTL